MAPETRPCGSSDTVARRPRGPATAGWAPALPPLERAFVLALAVALLLHIPFVPLQFFEWVRMTLFGHIGDYDDADAQAVVPIDLDLLAKDPVPEPPPPPPPAPPPASTGEAADAGAPHDAGAPPPARPPADAGPRPLSDPTSAAGGAGKIAAKDPNVQILIAGKVLRRHPLGAWGSRMLLAIPEWQRFFEGVPLDPVKDLDHLLITAPRLRSDSSKMVAVLEYNFSSDMAREAVDQVLHRTNGVWIEDAPVTAARATVGGAPRLLAILPQRRLMLVLPGEAQDQLERLKQAKSFRNSAEGVVVSLLTPARPFKELLHLPESLKWLRAALTPTPDGGVDLALELGDASADEARDHAALLTREIDARRKVDVVGLTQLEIVDAVTFTAGGDVIRARTHVAPEKLSLIMDWVEQKARERYRAR